MSTRYKIILKVNNVTDEEIVVNDHMLSITILTAILKKYFNKECISSNIDYGIIEVFHDNGHVCHYHIDDNGKLAK